MIEITIIMTANILNFGCVRGTVLSFLCVLTRWTLRMYRPGSREVKPLGKVLLLVSREQRLGSQEGRTGSHCFWVFCVWAKTTDLGQGRLRFKKNSNVQIWHSISIVAGTARKHRMKPASYQEGHSGHCLLMLMTRRQHKAGRGSGSVCQPWPETGTSWRWVYRTISYSPLISELRLL